MQDITKWISPANKYLIYGTALFGRYVCDKICQAYGEDKVIGFLESIRSTEPFDGGKPVYLLNEAFEKFGRDVFIVVTGIKSAAMMKENLLSKGFDENHIIIPEGYGPYFQVGYSKQVEKVAFFPVITPDDKDVITKINWFLPDKLKVSILVDGVGDNRISFRNNVVLFSDVQEYNTQLENAEIIFIWDLSREGDMAKRYPEKIRVVDRDFYLTIDSDNYDQIYYNSFSDDERDRIVDGSKHIFCRMKELSNGYKRANIFCSGPSLSEIYDDLEQFNKDFNIICNSMVKDKELLSSLRPQLLTFADTDFFMSPGVFGEAFYKDLIDTFRKYRFFIAVREHQMPLILFHFPELKDYIMGLPYAHEKGDWFIDEKRFCVKPMANILTDMMLPIASSLFNEVRIAGCTGRKKEETYFWEHGERVQYLDLKPYVFEMWRGFFHKRRYGDYFDMHCQYVKNMLEYGEKLGKRYENITSTYIPALQERGSIKVSIITVCKNSKDTIERTIRSVLGQQYRNIEYIVVDGASTDGTVDTIKKYSNGISAVISEPDNGMYDAMNKGIESSTGDIIGIINSDDWYEENAVSNVVNTVLATKADVVYGYQMMVHEHGRRAKAPCGDASDLWHGMPFGHPTVFVRREVYEKYGLFSTDWKIVADHELMLRVYTKGAKFVKCPEVIANFSLNGISSMKRTEVMREARRLMMKYVDSAPDPGSEKIRIDNTYEKAMAEAQLIEANGPMVERVINLLESKDYDIYIWGTGYWGGWIFKLLKKCNFRVTAFLDNNADYQGIRMFGRPVLNPEVLSSLKALIFVSVERNQEELIAQIEDYKNADLKVISLDQLIQIGHEVFKREN